MHSVWRKTRLKYVAEINRDVLPESTSPSKGFRYIDVGNVTQGNMDTDVTPIRFSNAPSRARRLAEVGDTVVSTVRTYLRAVAAVPPTTDMLVFSTGFAVFHPVDTIVPRYLSWYLQGDEFVSRVEASSVGVSYPAITAAELSSMGLYLPPLDDQRAIADYLDRETQKIDELIAEQRGLIETLRERSRALIERAVTRGVSGDATESSEIPWLYGGQVVAHWTTSRIKYMFSSLRAGAMIPADSINADGDYPVYGGNGKRGYTNEFTHDGVHILIGRQGALCGNVHLCQGRFWSSEHAIVGEPVRNVAPRWLEFLLRIMDLGQYSMASAQPGIGVGQIATLQIPFPPPSEQREIIEYLDGQTARIDELIAESEDLIALSQERRAALITAAVTGQIDVRTET